MNDKTFNKLENLQMEAGHSERSLERKNFDLQTIYDVSKELMNRKGVQEIMENLLLMVMGNFGAVNGIILLVCTDKNKIEVSVQRGMEKPALDMLSRVIESGYFNELQKVTSVQIMGEGDNVDQEAVKNLFSLLSSFKINVWISFVVNEEKFW